MQKAKIMCLILAVVMASAGTVSIALDLTGNSAAPVMPDNAVNTVLDKPSEGTPVDYDAIKNLYVAQGELQRKGGFVGTTRGTAVSAGISQDVFNNRVVIGEKDNKKVFKEMITTGAVKNAYQLYLSGDNYLYRKFDSIKKPNTVKWADTASKYNEADFYEKFGHRSDSLTGYILNDETITSGTLEKQENGLFTYRYVLDTEKSPARMLYEMKTNSNMSGFATFIKAEIVVTMDAAWQVKTLTTDCKYKVPMFGGINCVEDVTETFSDLTSDELPETDFFKQFFNAQAVTPIEPDKDVLNILMEMFEPYVAGDNLNVSINAEADNKTVLTGLVSAKIDIENIENIEVSALLGNDLIVEYQHGKVYVTYQDFKASTTVDGIMDALSAFMPASAYVDGEEEDSDILSKFTYQESDGLCTVNLSLDIENERLDVNIYANVIDGKYVFRNANVTLGSLSVNAEPVSNADIPARSGAYPEILGLLDIVKNGVIYGNVNAFGMNVDVMFDLASASAYAKADDLSVNYQNETVYVDFGAIKAKLNVNDIDGIMSLLRIAGVLDNGVNLQLPQISLDKVITALSGISAVATDGGTVFTLSADGFSAAIYLAVTDNGWALNKITVSFGENTVTLAPASPFADSVPEVNEADYADVADVIQTFLPPAIELVNARGYAADFQLDLVINEQTFNVNGSFAYDEHKNINVKAVVSNAYATVIKADVTLAEGIVYLDINGLKCAFELPDSSIGSVDAAQIAAALNGASDEVKGLIDVVCGIVNTVKNIDIKNIDFANVLKSFGYDGGTVSLTVNGDLLGLDDFGVRLYVNNKGKLEIGIDGLELADITVNAAATVRANVKNVSVPNAGEYALNLAGKVENVNFLVTADLLGMDISAKLDVLDQTVVLRYVNNKVYATVGEIAIVASLNELDTLIEQILAVLPIDVNNMDLSGLADLDLSIQSVISALRINLSDAAPSIGLELEGLGNVYVSFDSDANFVNVSASVMGYNAEIVKSAESAPKLDLNDVYIPVEPLAMQLVEIYNNYKNVTSTGLQSGLTATLTVGGADYTLNAQVQYNNGLHVNAKLADDTNVLAVIDLYLVNKVIYLDVNGVRVATELAAGNLSGNNVDIAAVLGMLSKAKGYNDVLDSVIAVAEELPAKLSGINYLDLLASVDYDNGVLTAAINGELLGLSNFNVSLAGTSDVTLTLNGLTVGNVTLNKLTANANPSCDKVNPPTEKYVTELEVEAAGLTIVAKLDLLNKTVVAKTTLLERELGIMYKDGTVYATFGAVSAKLDIENIDKLIGFISSLTNKDMPAINMDGVDVKQILNGIKKTVNNDGYTLSVSVAEFDVALTMNGEGKLTAATVNVNGVDVKAKVISGASYPSFNLNAKYVDAAALAEQAIEIYNGYKDVLNTGIRGTLNTNVTIDGTKYVLSATVEYRSGLHVNATVKDGSGVLAVLDMYLVNNVIYLDVNGVRVATELAANNASNSNVDMIAVLGMLSKAKGYNDVLDSVIAVIEQIPEKINGVNYIDLITALSYQNNELSVTVDGTHLGLSQFEMSLAGKDNVTLALSGLTIGGLTVNELSIGVNPSCEKVNAPAEQYVTELEVEAAGLTIVAKLDLLNKTVQAKTTLLNNELALLYKDGTVYVNYSGLNALLNVNDIDKLLEVVNMFKTVSVPSLDVDVKNVLNSVTVARSGNGYALNVQIAGVNVTANFNGEAKLTTASVNVNGIQITAKRIEGASYTEVDTSKTYVDIVELAQIYAGAIKNLTNAIGYAVKLNGQIAVDGHNYDVAVEVSYNNGLYVNADVSYNSVKMIKAQLWYVNGTLYAQVGDLKLAVKLDNGGLSAQNGAALDLSKFKGYNAYVDGILDAVQNVINKFNANEIDYASLLNGISCNGTELTININAADLGLSAFTVRLNAENALTAEIDGLNVNNVNIDLTASVAECNQNVTAPDDDFTTNLAIKLDDNNTVYANLDLINGVYNFRLDDLYVVYSNKTVKINRQDMYLSGNIDKITEFFKKIDALVNEFSGATESTVKLPSFDTIDVKALVQSLTVKTDNGSVILGAKLMGIDVTVTLTNGALSSVSAPIDFIVHKNVQVFASAQKQQYADFPADANYIALEQVFEDYFPAIEALVHTNSWKFSFEGDTLFSINKTNYMLASGSYFEFYYKNTEGMSTFKLRAKLDVRKQKDNGWQEFMSLDIAYKDGSIYVTDTGRKVGNNSRNTIRITVSVDTLLKCYGLYDDLVSVIPQIGELVDSIEAARKEAEEKAPLIQMSTILTKASYTDGVFGLTLNGSALLSKLGEITLNAQTEGDGLLLNYLGLSYDGITLDLNGMRVTASDLVEVDGKTEYATVQDINAYDYDAYHMDFNSLYELLNSFVITAKPINNSNVRSFFIEGDATVKLKIIGINLADIDMKLSVKVDINEDNKVYIAVKINRTKPSGIGTAFVNVYEDEGGDSYLYYDGVNETFSVIRNSITDKYKVTEYEITKQYCSKCGSGVYSSHKCIALPTIHKDKYYTEEWGWVEKEIKYGDGTKLRERHYAAENLTTEQFTANIMDYIFELFNFGSTIKDPIVKAINEPSSADFGIEDILKDYKHETYADDKGGKYALQADLRAIDSNLGDVSADIVYVKNHVPASQNDRKLPDYSLTNLNISVGLLNGMCQANIPFTLQKATYQEATDIVKGTVFW